MTSQPTHSASPSVFQISAQPAGRLSEITSEEVSSGSRTRLARLGLAGPLAGASESAGVLRGPPELALLGSTHRQG